MLNITNIKRKAIDSLLDSKNVEFKSFISVANIFTGESTNEQEKKKYSFKIDNCRPYISTKDISMTGCINYENGMYIPKNIEKFSIAPQNSILLCIEGGNAGNKIAITDKEVCFVNKLCCFHVYGAQPKYVYYYLLSNEFRNNFKEQMTGLIGGVSVKKIKELLIPLPSLEEQNTIVSKLDEIFVELDKVETNRNKLLDIQDKLQSKILKLAIQGKLVEQRPEEGTGEDLFKIIKQEKLELIKSGKIKKEKSVSEIEESEIPFEIPSSWKWVRMNEVLDVRDGTHDSPKYYPSGVPFITSKNLINGDISFDKIKFITNEDAKKINERSRVDDGDILFAMIGTIGNPVIVQKTREFCIKNVALFKNYSKKIEIKFIYYYLVFAQKSLEYSAKASVQQFVSLSILRNYIFPLPPLEEQNRIVKKIEQIEHLLRN